MDLLVCSLRYVVVGSFCQPLYANVRGTELPPVRSKRAFTRVGPIHFRSQMRLDSSPAGGSKAYPELPLDSIHLSHLNRLPDYIPHSSLKPLIFNIMFGNDSDRNDRDDQSTTSQPRSNPASNGSKPAPPLGGPNSSQNPGRTPLQNNNNTNPNEPNPFVAFRQSTDRLITHILSTTPTLSDAYTAIKSQFSSFDSDRAMRKFTESYERSTDPQRTGAAGERKTQAQREKEMEEREKRNGEWENAANSAINRLADHVWYPRVGLPDEDVFNFNSNGWFPMPGQGREGMWPFGRGANGSGRIPWMEEEGKGRDGHDKWRPSLEWMVGDRYSPLILERRAGAAGTGKWREAFEELLETQQDGVEDQQNRQKQKRISSQSRSESSTQEVVVKTNIEDATADQWLGNLIKRQLVSVHPFQQAGETGKRDPFGFGMRHGPWHNFGQLGFDHHPWGFGQDEGKHRRRRGALQPSQEHHQELAETRTEGSEVAGDHSHYAGPPAYKSARQTKEDNDDEDDGPETELDMYERFLKGESVTRPAFPRPPQDDEPSSADNEDEELSPTTSLQSSTSFGSTYSTFPDHISGTDDAESGSRVVSTSTSTSTRVTADGTSTTKTVIRRRFADGREEVEEKSSTGKVPHWQNAIGTHEEEVGPVRRESGEARMKRRVWDITGGEEKEIDEPVPAEKKDVQKKNSSWFWSRD